MRKSVLVLEEMKKKLTLLVFMLLPLAVNAAVQIDGIYYNLDSSNKTAEVARWARGHKYTGDIVIPSSIINGEVEYNVTSIVAQAFASCPDLTSVTIPNSVIKIGGDIFSGCTGLASIIINEGNPTYDSRENCNAIIETSSNKLLYACMSTVIPNGVTSIDKSAFKHCSGLAFINIPNSITSIEDGMFSGCNNLIKVELNSNAIVSKRYNYESDYSIKKIFGSQVEEYILGEDVTEIGSGAFYECGQLTSIHMSDNVTAIGESAFYYCFNLTSINMSNNLTSLGDFAFIRCYNLKSITIPRNLAKIEHWTFSGCSGLTKVELNSNTIVSNDNGYNSMASYFGSQVEEYILGEEVTSIGKHTFFGCTGATSINIPNKVTNIGEGAFQNCSALTSIIIPDKVTSIGDNAFQNCINLLSIQVESGNTMYDSRENCNALIETSSNTLLWGCQNTVIPNSVTGIADYAFYGCAGLTTINIPNGITKIGNYVFCGCTNLTSISIPNSVTSIGKLAFAGCYALTSIIIPNSVTLIDEYAFNACSGLTSIIIPNSVTVLESSAFYLCTGLTTIQVESGNMVYDSRDNCNAIIKTADNTLIIGCQNTIIPNSVTAIGKGAFFHCIGLTSISIPGSVTTIGDSAFADCIGLTTITIPNGVTTIEQYAFVNCYAITSIILPNNITNIGEGAFRDSYKTTDVYCYAEQVPETGSNVFEYLRDATLHVPAASIETYSNAELWKDFKNIVALTDDDPKPTGIIETTTMHLPTISECYDMNGRCINLPQRGLNIVKMSDGTTKKIVVK